MSSRLAETIAASAAAAAASGSKADDDEMQVSETVTSTTTTIDTLKGVKSLIHASAQAIEQLALSHRGLVKAAQLQQESTNEIIDNLAKSVQKLAEECTNIKGEAPVTKKKRGAPRKATGKKPGPKPGTNTAAARKKKAEEAAAKAAS
jgi:hypothetical protein